MVETADGVLITPYDPTVDQAFEAYRLISKKYRGALRELAR